MNTTQLKIECAKNNLKKSGKKQEILQRLIDFYNGVVPEDKPTNKKKKKKRPNTSIHLSREITFTYNSTIGKYVDDDTNLVVDEVCKKVIGQMIDDKFIPINKSIIYLCEYKKISYLIPTDLGLSVTQDKPVADKTYLDELEKKLNDV